MPTDGAVQVIQIELTAYEARALARTAGLWEGILSEISEVIVPGGVPPLASAQAKLELALMLAEEPVT